MNVKHLWVKRNLNFLEYPSFISSKSLSEDDEYEIKGKYKLTNYSGNELPSNFDVKILYSLLALAQEIKSPMIEFNSANELLTLLGMSKGGKEHERILESIDKWNCVRITFEDEIYYKKNTNSPRKAFWVIASYQFPKEVSDKRKIYIRFADEFFDEQTGDFSRNIKVSHINELNSGVTTRLYELLSKNLYKRDEWKAEATRLSELLGIEYTYPERLHTRVERAMNELNEKHFNALFTWDRERNVYSFQLRD